MAFNHTSVLLHETVDGLNVKPDGIYVDATLGGGGHAYEVCSQLGEQGRFIGIDQDAAAIEAAGKRLEGFGEKVTIIRSNYRSRGIILSARYCGEGIFLPRRRAARYEDGPEAEDDGKGYCQ